MANTPVAQLLHPSRVLLNLAATEKDDAILELAGFVRRDPDVLDFPTFSRELIERDKLSSTAAGYGVAFPHARTDAVREIVIAAGRSTGGVTFGEEKVHYIFVIGTPREKVADYLVAVGGLARLLRAEPLRAALAQTQTPEDFIRVLSR